MKYASTVIEKLEKNQSEKIVDILDLNLVPYFDQNNPPPRTYVVNDDVQIGWVKNENGTFSAPPPVSPSDIVPPAPDQPITTGTKAA